MKKTQVFLIIIWVIGFSFLLSQLLPGFIFFFLLLTDNGGRLNSPKLINDMVIENQAILDETATELLTMDSYGDIYIKADGISVFEGDDLYESMSLDDFGEGLEWLFEEEYVENIRIYNCEDAEIIIFQTSSTGIVGSSSVQGFCYIEEGNEEQVFDIYSLFPWKKVVYEEITPKWFYYEGLE